MKNSTNDVQVQLRTLYKGMQNLIDEIDRLKQNPNNQSCLNEDIDLASILVNKRKALDISIEDLAIQTEISFSTLQRVLKDPHNAKLDNILKICNELGLKLWIEE